MKNFVNIRLSIILISLIIFSGCAVNSLADESEKMLSLGSALTKLSAAVDSTVRYEDLPEDISDSELLALATKHDPTLLSPFSDYVKKVRRQNHHAIMLICSGDGKQALIEDVGCTAKLDKHSWEIKPALSCEFTLTVSNSCEVGNN